MPKNDAEDHRPAPPVDPNADASPSPKNVVVAGWTGPLPPPAVLRQFDEIVTGGAERIFRQFELEADHRRDQERLSLRFETRYTHVGQALAAAFVAAVLLIIYLIAKDAPAVAGILAGGTIVSGIIAFLKFGNWSRSE